VPQTQSRAGYTQNRRILIAETDENYGGNTRGLGKISNYNNMYTPKGTLILYRGKCAVAETGRPTGGEGGEGAATAAAASTRFM